jgi:hypothetical protein
LPEESSIRRELLVALANPLERVGELAQAGHVLEQAIRQAREAATSTCNGWPASP